MSRDTSLRPIKRMEDWVEPGAAQSSWIPAVGLIQRLPSGSQFEWKLATSKDEYPEEPTGPSRFDDVDDKEKEENAGMLVPNEYADEDMPIIEWDRNNPNLTRGTVFKSMKDYRNALTTYCIVTQNDLLVDKSEPRRISKHKNITKAKKWTKRNIAQVDLTSTQGEPTIEATSGDDFQQMVVVGFQALVADDRLVQPMAPEVVFPLAITCSVTGSTSSRPPPLEPVVKTERTKVVNISSKPIRNTRGQGGESSKKHKEPGNDRNLSLNFEMM
ncbi:hypothetical protein D1007_52755 [Hordeum vulgare]|nr:hypothetical protein D1007_52755 [Hordeum vulgare]